MKTILISGGGGYLGTQLSQYLLKNHKVIILFATVCQNNKTAFTSEDLNLEPYTISASNFSKGDNNLG